jgi:hypothetical protein
MRSILCQPGEAITNAYEKIQKVFGKREDYTMHSLCLRRLAQLTAERVDGSHVSGISSIPVITHARPSHFLD